MRGDGVAPAAAGNDQPPPKRRRKGTGHSTNSFLRSWAWKREHRCLFERSSHAEALKVIFFCGMPLQALTSRIGSCCNRD